MGEGRADRQTDKKKKPERSRKEAVERGTQDQFYRAQTIDVLHLQLKYDAELNTGWSPLQKSWLSRLCLHLTAQKLEIRGTRLICSGIFPDILLNSHAVTNLLHLDVVHFVAAALPEFSISDLVIEFHCCVFCRRKYFNKQKLEKKLKNKHMLNYSIMQVISFRACSTLKSFHFSCVLVHILGYSKFFLSAILPLFAPSSVSYLIWPIKPRKLLLQLHNGLVRHSL